MNDVRVQKHSSLVVTTGGLSLAVGSLMLSLCALSVYRFNQAQEVAFNASSWNWLGEVHLRLDRGVEPLGPQLSEAEFKEPVFVGPRMPARADSTVSESQSRRTLVQNHRKLVKRKKVSWLARAGRYFQQQNIARTASHVETAPVTIQSDTASASKNEMSQSAQAETRELNTLQLLHQSLRGRFLLAMSSQSTAETLIAAQEQPSLEAVQQKVPKELAAVEVAPEPLAFRPNRQHKASRAVAQPKLNEVAQFEAPIESSPASSQDDQADEALADVTTHSADEQLDAKSANSEMAHAQLPSVDTLQWAQAAPEAQEAAGSSGDYSPPENDSKGKAEPKILVSSGSRSIWVGSSVGAAAPDHPNQGKITSNHAKTPSNILASNADRRATTDSDPAVRSRVTTQGLADSAQAGFVQKSNVDYSIDAMTTHTRIYKTEPIPLTEAFEWNTPISGGYSSYISKENSDAHKGWVMSHALDHWPTLARQNASSIPLISKNTGMLLSTLAGAALETEAGIVFGKVPAGWTVRLSGRSERPVFLNERNQSISPSNLEGERYFAFLNVAPGAHLVYLANRTGVEEGAIGVAVLGGTATYADLRTIKKVSLNGRVFDGSDSRSRSMSGITVRVLGALSAKTESAANGKFSIDNVLTVGDYPIYVESSARGGYTHRYQLAPKQLQNATLFRLSESAIQGWINQLEGSISPDSGIIVAAAPQLLSSLPGKPRLIPAVQSLASNPTLRPEVYTLSAAGQMQVGQALDQQNVRLVSVQVPEGAAILRLLDSEKASDKALVSSEMIMVSPAVVNVVGPY
jgi:hypothetical protein